MHKESSFAIAMNYAVSGYVYFVAFMLVLYMISSLIAGIWSLAAGLIELASSPRGIFIGETSGLELDLLHTIAFTIVLVKAYKILISYAQTRTINIKFLVEIAIIGPTIELLFNSRNYPIEVNLLFAAFAFANLIAYLLFYTTLRKSSDDYAKDIVAQCEVNAAGKKKAPVRKKTARTKRPTRRAA
ncbi:hypothetical protein KC727_01270 [Candidatus Kaiserbacteria bacterium]|nr:hypothetical protein [Candidatus Kaiserbacteria bacterium]